MKNLVLIVLNLLVVTLCYGQTDSNNVRIYASPGEYYRVKINNQLQPVSSKFHLDSGTYNISVWAPNYFQFDTAIVVGAEKIYVKTALKKTTELLKYEQLLIEHKRAKKKIGLSLFSFMTLSSMSVINYNQIGKDNLTLIQAQYRNDYAGTTYSDSDELLSAQKKHKIAIVRQSILYTGIGISTVLLVKHLLNKSKIEMPYLPEDRLFETVDLGLILTPMGTPGLNLRLNLASK
ncbi:MAG: hypothetical protein JKY42_12030 [Flavobacteriales bacterium]|nr:hypothetical protein [Flavobacteriales bacterium]